MLVSVKYLLNPTPRRARSVLSMEDAGTSASP